MNADEHSNTATKIRVSAYQDTSTMSTVWKRIV